MKSSEKGLAIIKKYEGCKLTSYKCPAGKWTIGYGHTAGVTEGQTITQAQAEAYLKQDVAWAEKAVNNLGRNFNQNQFDALVSFTYNLGAGNLSTLCGKNRDIAAIGQNIILYDKAGGKVLNGLLKRRTEEQKLFNTPVSDQPGGGDKMPTISRGHKGDAVRKLQSALLKQNFKTCMIDGKKKILNVDGDWGGITDSIFRRWQGYVGLEADGICGPRSWAKLGY